MDIEAIFPKTKIIQIQDETLEISPIRVRQLPGMIKCINRLAPYFDMDSPDVLGMLAAGAGEVIEGISIATGKPVEWIEDLGVDEMIRLVGAVIEVNADFFIRAVMPAINQVVDEIQKMRVQPPGPTSFNS